jgi:hypothetical protein
MRFVVTGVVNNLRHGVSGAPQCARTDKVSSGFFISF